MKVRKRMYRFRILNGSLARGYKLKLSNGKPFTVIATDGGFMHEPKSVTQLTVGMAERYEIVIDFSSYAAGTKIQLLNGGVKNARDYDHTGKVMQFEVDGGTPVAAARKDDNGPLNLEEFKKTKHSSMTLTPSQSTATRKLELERTNGMWVINDETWDDVVRSKYEHVFAKTDPNAVEIWEVTNSSGGWFHPLHIHLVDFQVLSRNGAAPRPEETGPKDVVYVGEGETIRLLMRFEHEEGRYMIHCHNLSHEDHDMMTQFQVGHHDVDCDPINSDLPRTGTPDWSNCDPYYKAAQEAAEEAAEAAEDAADDLADGSTAGTPAATPTEGTTTTGTAGGGTTTSTQTTTSTSSTATSGSGSSTATSPSASAATTTTKRRGR
jgi:spore coat protein A